MVSIITVSPLIEKFEPFLTRTNQSEGLNFATSLMDLQPYMEPIELEPGAFLYAQDGGVVEESQRGVSHLFCWVWHGR